jgi:hypothetical protein
MAVSKEASIPMRESRCNSLVDLAQIQRERETCNEAGRLRGMRRRGTAGAEREPRNTIRVPQTGVPASGVPASCAGNKRVSLGWRRGVARRGAYCAVQPGNSTRSAAERSAPGSLITFRETCGFWMSDIVPGNSPAMQEGTRQFGICLHSAKTEVMITASDLLCPRRQIS